MLPAITGTEQSGQTLSVSTGTWSGSPTNYRYVWVRAGGSVGTGLTYVLTGSDVGSTLTVVVTATNALGATAVTTAATGVIAAAATPTAFALLKEDGSYLKKEDGFFILLDVIPTGEPALLKEDGSYLLLETGDHILLDTSGIVAGGLLDVNSFAIYDTNGEAILEVA